jgi:primosomal protein N' (replication factor Y)
VVEHDYKSFYHDVIQERSDFHYPPFYHLVYVYLKHRNSDTVELAANELGNRLRQGFGQRVLGPDKPAVARVKTLAIRKIVIKLENGVNLPRCKQYMKAVYQQLLQDKRYASLQVYYDVDPQ